MRAYVLVRVTTGREREVMEVLRSIPTVRDVHFLFGDFDYILTVDATDWEGLSRLVTNRVRKISGIEKTVTLLEASM